MTSTVRRAYLVTWLYDLNTVEFSIHYKEKIRSSNAQYPDCVYFVYYDEKQFVQFEEFLREIGIAPYRIIVVALHDTVVVTRYKSPVMYCYTANERDETIIHLTTHDIYWERDPSENTPMRRRLKHRMEIIKKYPYI